MYQNAKPTEQVAILDALDPSSQAAGSASTAWVNAAQFQNILAIIQTGALGAAATVDAKLRQAKDAAGTGAKDIDGAAISQLVKASDDDVQAEINLNVEQLDVEGGFGYVALQVTVGTAESLTAGLLLGFTPRTFPPTNVDSVVQVVG